MITVILTIVIFSILIVIHEFGHYIAAKWAKVRVEKFAIGFGPPLLKIKGKETEFLICAFPLGGYIKLAGDSRTETKGLDHEFLSKPVGVRARIVFFGPLFNVLLTFVIFWFIFAVFGFPSPKPIVGGVIKYDLLPKSEFRPDLLAKLKDAEIIKEIGELKDKFKRATWNVTDVDIAKLQSAGFSEDESKRLLKIWDESSKLTHKNRFSKELFDKLIDKNIVNQKMLYWNVSDEEELKTKLAESKIRKSKIVLAALGRSEFPAYHAGVKEDDLILAIDDQKVSTWEEMSELIKASQNKLILTVLRDDQEQEIVVIPQKITIKKDLVEEEEVSVIYISPKEVRGNVFVSFFKAGEKLFYLGRTIIEGFALLITRKVPFQEAVAGPIRIGAFTAEVAKRGIIPLFNFAGMLSLSLAIINLFPFPILDGGHLSFMLLEKLRNKPLSPKKEDILSQIGFVCLISLMLFVCYNDIVKVSFKRRDINQERFQKLKSKNIIEYLEDDENYVFWTIAKEEDLSSRLSEIETLDAQEVLSIWAYSPKVTKVVLDD